MSSYINFLSMKKKIFYILLLSLILIYKHDVSNANTTTKVHFIAVGDIVAHKALTRSGLKGNGFYTMFKPISSYFKKADFVIANLEAPAAANIRVSGYPRFNAHPWLVRAAKKSGINFLSTANTHSLDKNAKGILGTIATMKKYKVYQNGMNASSENHFKPTLVVIKGIKCAFFSVVTRTNLNRNPRGRNTPKVNKIKTKKMLSKSINEIKKIRPNVDLIILLFHAGEEHKPYASRRQKYLANVYAKAGVDIIFGSHPHVLQPISFLNNGKTFCIYSLSNILSYMVQGVYYRNWRSWAWRTPLGDGILLHVYVQKKNGKTRVVKYGYTPTWSMAVPSGNRNFRYKYYATVISEEIKRIQDSNNTFLKKNFIPLLKLRRKYIIRMYGKRYLIEGIQNL